jgi:hypothetical protein
MRSPRIQLFVLLIDGPGPRNRRRSLPKPTGLPIILINNYLINIALRIAMLGTMPLVFLSPD